MTNEIRNSNDVPLAVGVVGCGRMGRLHARVYSQMKPVRLVGVYDANAAAAEGVAKDFSCRAFASPGEMLEQVRAVTIAVPTQYHADVAEPFLRRGIGCLIEKPLAKDVPDAQRIIELARASGATVQVGHIERFNPAVRAMERLNITPGYIEVNRVSPMTFRSIDVGVVLDMMIHDIDIVLKLAQSKVTKIDAAGVSVVADHEDVCNARLLFANGCEASLTASRLAMRTDRRLRIFSRDAYVSLDYQRRQGVVIHRSGNLSGIRDAVAKLRSGEIQDLTQLNYADLVKIEQLDIDDVEPLRAQLDAFVAAVRDKTEPVVSAEDGLAAVQVAKQIVDSISPTMVL